MLSQKFPDADLKLISQQSIGAAVSGEITRDAFIAIGLSLLLILVYVAFRFELSYGIGAVVATFHDVVMTIASMRYSASSESDRGNSRLRWLPQFSWLWAIP